MSMDNGFVIKIVMKFQDKSRQIRLVVRRDYNRINHKINRLISK